MEQGSKVSPREEHMGRQGIYVIREKIPHVYGRAPGGSDQSGLAEMDPAGGNRGEPGTPELGPLKGRESYIRTARSDGDGNGKDNSPAPADLGNKSN